MEKKIAELVKKCFQCYQTGDKKTLEDLLSEEFTFTSPYDDHINKTEYFKRCWSFNEERPVFTFIKIIAEGSEAFVIYECESGNNKKFRNTEFFKFDGEKIREVEVYFGDAPVG